MKGDMELEIPVKVVIALIVVMVVVSFIMLVSRAVRQRLSEPEKEDIFTVSQPIFTADDISRYESLCYEKVKNNIDKATTCFLLKGDFSAVDFTSMGIDCDPSKGFLIVRYVPSRGVVIDC